MPNKLNVCLMNDSFPPTVDGVAMCVANYAAIIERDLGHAMVCTPYYPGVYDDYPYPVIRYPSVNMNKTFGYRAGFPFDTRTLDRLRDEPIDIIHAHCPVMSTTMARTLRESINKPIILTYHTKFDVDIRKDVPLKSMQNTAIKLLISNVEACDEVWVVSRGAGENLRSLGYRGDYMLMENGVDFPKGRADEEKIRRVNEQCRLSPTQTVFLFVGRIMWYKGLKIILDGLKIARDRGACFQMLFVGDGADKNDVMVYANSLGLQGVCQFIPSVHDREMLRAYYSRASLFLFPSDFDTNGLVVREAAACATPSLVLEKSCASEGITDARNGLMIKKDAQALAQRVCAVCDSPDSARDIGERAMNEIYVSWDDAVGRAYDRYQVVAEAYARTAHAPKPIHKGDDFFRFMSYVCTNKKHNTSLKRQLYKPVKHKVFKAKKRSRDKSLWL